MVKKKVSKKQKKKVSKKKSKKNSKEKKLTTLNLKQESEIGLDFATKAYKKFNKKF